MSDLDKLALVLTAVFAVAIDGVYAAFCWVTDTWKDVPPSAHVTALTLGAIGGGILAIVFTSAKES